MLQGFTGGPPFGHLTDGGLGVECTQPPSPVTIPPDVALQTHFCPRQGQNSLLSYLGCHTEHPPPNGQLRAIQCCPEEWHPACLLPCIDVRLSMPFLVVVAHQLHEVGRGLAGRDPQVLLQPA